MRAPGRAVRGCLYVRAMVGVQHLYMLEHALKNASPPVCMQRPRNTNRPWFFPFPPVPLRPFTCWQRGEQVVAEVQFQQCCAEGWLQLRPVKGLC